MKKSMVWTVPIALGLCAALVWPAAAQKGVGRNTTLSRQDRKFVMNTAVGNMTEVRLGELATRQGTGSGVKDFGQRMVTDHSKANDELKQLAADKGITLPNTIGSKNESTYAHLQRLNGMAFDRSFIKDMVSDHKKVIAAFRKEANKGHDPDIRSWAAKTLPTLQEHLSMATNLNNQFNGQMHRSRHHM
jgi:putative membrane protein